MRYYRGVGGLFRSRPLRIVTYLLITVSLVYYLLTVALHDHTEELKDTPVRLAVSEGKTIARLHIQDLTMAGGGPSRLSNLSAANPPYNIPRIIHQSWNDYNIPKLTEKWVKRWRETNPGWKYMFWTDKSSRQFMAKYFPAYLDLYDGFQLPVQRADLFRYFLLFSIGGVYADIDVEPLRALDNVRNMSACVLSQEPEPHFRILHPYFGTAENNYTLACNAFMACRPRHPFLAYLIQQIAERRNKTKTCILPETLLCTGPYILSVSWVKYKALMGPAELKNRPEDDVICPEADYFLPTWDPLRKGWLRAVCLSRSHYDKLIPYSKRLCQKLKKENFANKVQPWSYTNHHWFHSWTDERKRYLKRSYAKLHISSVVPYVIYGADYAT